MRRKLLLTIFLTGLLITSFSQNLLKRAHEEFENQNYQKAIDILDQAVSEDSLNAEAYFYRGYFRHYLAYDSRPLSKYSMDWSDDVINDLEKAIKLNGELGDAFYFIGAEYGARATKALQMKDANLFVKEFQTGYQKCGFPEWYVEYGRNMLKLCDSNSILLTIGDMQYNAIQVVQQLENYRKDISVIPSGYLMGRPWMVEIIKKGLTGVFKKVPLTFTEEQISDIRPYKWDTNFIEIDVSDEFLRKFNLEPGYQMQWKVVPDLSSENRTFLSPWTAVLVSIIEANAFERPVYLTQGWNEELEAGLGSFTMNCGLVRRVMPFVTANTLYENDYGVIEKVLLDRKNFSGLESLSENDMPRVSGMLFNYHYSLYSLANYYYSIGYLKKVKKIRNFIEKRLLPDYFPKSKQIIVLLDRVLEER